MVMRLMLKNGEWRVVVVVLGALVLTAHTSADEFFSCSYFP